MNNSRPIVNISLLLGTIIAVSAFFLVFNNIPVQALHKEQQLLESFDDLADFANAVKNGDEELEEIPIQSMKDADIYDDADDNLKDCIDLAAEIGDSLTDKEVVHCVDDVNYFKNKYSNSTVPTNATSATTGVADTGSDTTSTSDTADTTSTSNADTNAADTTSSSNADTNTDVSSASDDTSSTNNEDNNDQSSNNNSNNPDDYDDLDVLVNDIKNGDVDTDEISLSAFQDSGAYQGADQETQDCIDLAGKIGNNLGDQEIRNCSEDPNFYKNEISSTGSNDDNNVDDSSNNVDDSSNNVDDSSNNADDSSNNADDSSNNADDSSNNADENSDSSNDNNN